MKKTYSAVATVATWKDPATGKEMKRQLEIGIFESKHGRLVLKLDAVPVAAEWSGWVSLHPVAPALPPGRKVSPGMPPAPPPDEGDARNLVILQQPTPMRTTATPATAGTTKTTEAKVQAYADNNGLPPPTKPTRKPEP